MLKKSLLAGVVGVFLSVGGAYAGGSGGCSGDTCGVSNPVQVQKGLDFKIDVDACVDAGNLMSQEGDIWSAQAVIYQEGNYNHGYISQTITSQQAGIVQVGNSDYANITQKAGNEYAFAYQGGSANTAGISQTLSNAAAIIMQSGNLNTAYINQ